MNETTPSGAREENAAEAAARRSGGFGSGGRINPKSPSDALRPERAPAPPPRSQQARHPIILIMNFAMTIIVVAVLGAAGLFVFGKMRFEERSHFDQPRTIMIERGTGLGEIAEQLHERGLISSKWIFIAGVRASMQQDSLKAGEYLIPAHASMRDIMNAMASGKGILYSISIPEGLTSQQIVDRLNADPVLLGAVAGVPAEGSLLPDTYRYTRGDSRQNIIERMTREHDRVVTAVWNGRDKDLPIATQDDLVTLASIVEKETGIADERSRVAAVFINRLRQNMRLQSDPTVIYGVHGGGGLPAGATITRGDLDAENEYNTYRIAGLPKGPIANPGRASLAAAANPSRTKDLYFVADGSGGHAFAETYADHRKNVARYRALLADQRANAAAGPGDQVDPDADAADGTAAGPPGDAAPADAPAPKAKP